MDFGIFFAWTLEFLKDPKVILMFRQSLEIATVMISTALYCYLTFAVNVAKVECTFLICRDQEIKYLSAYHGKALCYEMKNHDLSLKSLLI